MFPPIQATGLVNSRGLETGTKALCIWTAQCDRHCSSRIRGCGRLTMHKKLHSIMDHERESRERVAFAADFPAHVTTTPTTRLRPGCPGSPSWASRDAPLEFARLRASQSQAYQFLSQKRRKFQRRHALAWLPFSHF
jgi:hypothetical protein